MLRKALDFVDSHEEDNERKIWGSRSVIIAEVSSHLECDAVSLGF
jgi:hypothetical protein